MEKLEITILNPKVKKVLKDLEDLNLLAIAKPSNAASKLIEKLLSVNNPPNALPEKEIQEEVDAVRQRNYEAGKI